MPRKTSALKHRAAVTETLESRRLLAAYTPSAAVSTGSPTLGDTIARSTVPPSVIAGGTTHGTVTVDVSNTGIGADTSWFAVDVYASSDGLVDSSAASIGSATRRLTIKAGATGVVAVPVKSLPASLNGDYTLLATVSDSAGNAATTSTGPALTAAAPYVRFSETFIRTTLAASDVSGQKTKATVTLAIANSGNIFSKGESTIAFYATTDGIAADGTSIRSLTEPIVIKPAGSRTLTIPLLSIPAVINDSYELLAQLTDPDGDITDVPCGTYTFDAPKLVLEPSAASVVVAKSGTATLTFTLTNNGNITSTGNSTVAVLASLNGSLGDSRDAYSEPTSLPIAPGKARVVHVHLTAAQTTTLKDAPAAFLQITDPLGGKVTIPLYGF